MHMHQRPHSMIFPNPHVWSHSVATLHSQPASLPHDTHSTTWRKEVTWYWPWLTFTPVYQLPGTGPRSTVPPGRTRLPGLPPGARAWPGPWPWPWPRWRAGRPRSGSWPGRRFWFWTLGPWPRFAALGRFINTVIQIVLRQVSIFLILQKQHIKHWSNRPALQQHCQDSRHLIQ